MVNPISIEDYATLSATAHAAVFTDLKNELRAMDDYISSIFKGNFIVPIIAAVPAILFFFLSSVIAKVGCAVIVLLSIFHYFHNRKLATIKDGISEPETLVEQLERCQEYIEKLRFYYGLYTYLGMAGIYVGMMMITTGSLSFFPFDSLSTSAGFFIAIYIPTIYENKKYQRALNHTEAKVQSALGILRQEKQ
ncbi:hypothetical protein [Tunicatimonas pelagia]|uniref:hypothetical protein n=1 Tax=Tunicatimonas pelagia TaxID=931531 RepID=UPI002665A437|nr:hypothetical protein [Tunicatimonas pelagia]WKN45872.1 hypothetical protein P0M28_12975 [Tunicatimonas pelagia]